MLIIFDLDDTLLDTSGSITPFKLERALKRLQQEGLVLKNPQKALQELKSINESASSSSYALKEFFAINRFDLKFYPIAEEEIYAGSLEGIPLTLIEGAKELLKRLSYQYQLALVTAGNEKMQTEKITRCQLQEGIFSKIAICSSGEKESKYKQFLKEFNIKPSKAVVCADRIKQDLDPAKTLGMTTVHIKHGRGNVCPSNCVVDYTIHHLQQLEEVLSKIQRFHSLEEK